jgi:hypothetical protein
MAEANQSKVIIIPDGYNAQQRERIGQDIIDKIKRRTAEGLDVSNRPFARYSPNYDKTGTVNLKVSGDMLAGLTVLSTGVGFIRIGFDSAGTNDKAAYIQQPRGRKVSNQPIRTFVGISQADLNIILERYPLA